MSWVDGLLIGLGTGLQRAVPTYLEGRDRQRKQRLEDEEFIARRMEAVDRMMRDRDELSERKRSNRKQEDLEHERNVQSSLDRGLARENARATRDESSRVRLELAEMAEAGRNRRADRHEAAVSDRGSRPKPSAGLTQNQQNGLMLLNRDWLPGEVQQKAELEKLYRQAREAFPNAHPGDVAMAAQRMYDRVNRDRRQAKEDKYR